MKLMVRNFSSMARWGELDTDTLELRETPPPSGGAPPREHGYFGKLGDAEVVFYASAGKLRLSADKDPVELSDDLQVELAGEELRTLRLCRSKDAGGDVLLRLSYPNPVNPPMEFDLTMAEEEDFDLGLFVRNVVSSDRRREFMLAKWS